VVIIQELTGGRLVIIQELGTESWLEAARE